MIGFDEALEAILQRVKPLPRERARLEACLGRVLAEPVKARFDLPRFDQSAMDGFGVRVADIESATSDSPVRLTVSESIYAGDSASRRLRPGTAAKILTGSRTPSGVEAVVMKEYCEEDGDSVLVGRPAKPGENIRRRGEEFCKGDCALGKGARITPPVVGLLATFGRASVWVHRRPKVTVAVTGNEIVEPGQRLKASHIYDANSYALAAALADIGIDGCTVLRLRDDRKTLRKRLARALETSDVLITAGGVSVGDRDYVKATLEELGVKTVFWRVAIKPGKPNYFGVFGGKGRANRLAFGLPGNPVSALASYHQLVAPALFKMMGRTPQDKVRLQAVLDTDLRKKAGRLEWVRGVVRTCETGLVVTAVRGQGSHMLSGLATANCLIILPQHGTRFSKGDQVEVELLDWGGQWS